MWAVIICLALGLDQLWGEPKRFHPLVGFGYCANWLERVCNRGRVKTLLGLFSLILLTLPAWLIYLLQHGLYHWGQISEIQPLFTVCYYLVDLLVLYLVIGKRALAEHASAVAKPLLQGDLATARHTLSYMVSRDTREMNRDQITSSVIESVLENGNDAIFGALFWYMVAGAPGAVLYRISNTLDAMWGYRTARFAQFGFAAAKWDDLLNWVPARISALFFILLGHRRDALQSWRTQAALCASPNGGVVMTTGAGALQIIIGGPAVYFGELTSKPLMGSGQQAQAVDIERSIRLVTRCSWCWCGLALLIWLGAIGIGSISG